MSQLEDKGSNICYPETKSICAMLQHKLVLYMHGIKSYFITQSLQKNMLNVCT